MKKLIFQFLLTFNSLVINAQEANFNKLPNNTDKVNRMIKYAQQIQYTQPEVANKIIDDVQRISEDLHYNIGLAAANSFKAALFANKMRLDSAKIYCDKALQYIKERQSVTAKNQLASIYNTYGAIYQQRQQYDVAAKMYFNVIKLSEETKNHNKKAVAFFNLSILYSFIKDSLKTDKYARLSVAESKMTGDTVLILRTSLSMLNNFTFYNHYDSIPFYAKSILEMANKKKDLYSKEKVFTILGNYYYNRKKMYDTANLYFQQSLSIAREIKNPYDEAIVLNEIGNVYFYQKEYSKAINSFNQALKIEKENQLLQFQTVTLKSITEAEEKNGDTNMAFSHLKEYISLNDSLIKKTNEETVQMLDAKYQTKQKEARIQLQNSQLKNRKIVNYSLIGALATLILVGFLGYRNYKHKQKIQQQKIQELETEKQLYATEALLKGEDQERTRIAKDLHDGLGGLLSGIKNSFTTMKGNLIMTPDNAMTFERGIDMLDNSIKEMRRVAHNMMPEALLRFGIDTALRDYCTEINKSGTLNAIYQSSGMENFVIEQSTAIGIYRIIQELLNNAIKHSQASQLLVQLFNDNGKMIVNVEDNGKGFDKNILNNSKGIGWGNIKSRVDYLKGIIDLQTSSKNGTSVHIEIPLND